MRRSSRTAAPPAPEPRAAGAAPGAPFTALDFETADYGADSACALALVRVEGLQIVSRDM